MNATPERSPRFAKEPLDHRTLVITVDGSATAGKRLVAERLAERYDLAVLDTGASIRALALLAIEQKLVTTDATNIVDVPPDFIDKAVRLFDTMPDKLRILPPREDERMVRQLVGERDMRGELLTYSKQKAIENLSTIIAASPKMREKFYVLWRDAVSNLGGVVVYGRRTGVDLFPHAPVKVYLFASPEASAQYRVAHDPNSTMTIGSEAQYVREREGKEAAHGLLERAKDALVIDSSDYLVGGSQSIDRLEARIASFIDSRYIIR